MDTHCPIVLEARRLRLRCQQSWFLWVFFLACRLCPCLASPMFSRGSAGKESACSTGAAAAAAAKSLQLCPTLCDPIDGSPPGSPVPGILQARVLEWVAISFSNVWKWKWSHSVVSDSLWPYGLKSTKLLHPWNFLGKSTGMGCHFLLQGIFLTLTQMCNTLASSSREVI